jgi:palmitoyl-protein thioesterase
LDKSEFLAEANNERDYSDERKQKFLRLNRAMFIKWDSEQVIKPAESSWWGQYDINYNVLHRNSTDVYQKDLIGIRTLEEQGRAKFVSIPGGHMEFTFEQIDNIIIPFLLGN